MLKQPETTTQWSARRSSRGKERGRRGPKKRNYIKTELKTKQNELNPNPEPREPESISESKSERTVSGSNGMT